MDKKTHRIAGIDIGTNTILMLIADKIDNNYNIISDHNEIARLGEGVDKTNKISEGAIGRAIIILENYSQICKEQKVDEIRVVATSAMRDAENSSEVLIGFENAIGSKIRIVSGLKEASLSYLGTVNNSENALVIDIGGGSTEIISKSKDGIIESESLQIGSVRLTERFISDYPPNSNSVRNINNVIRKSMSQLSISPTNSNCYAVAGTPTTIARCLIGNERFDINEIHGFKIRIAELEKLMYKLIRMTPDEIISMYNIHPKRADVIAVGSMILYSVMEFLKIEHCKVNIFGLRLGIIKENTW